MVYMIDRISRITMITNQTALPVASSNWEGKVVTIPGGAGARDRSYACLKADDDNYHWVEVVNGGLE